jgi:hypothetical protein
LLLKNFVVEGFPSILAFYTSLNTEPYITESWKNTGAPQTEEANLSLFIGSQLFMFAVFNRDFTVVSEIESITINPQGLKNDDLTERLRFLITNHQLNDRKFKSVNICLLNSSFTLTPVAYSMQENAKSFLSFTNGGEQAVKNTFVHRFDELNFCYTVPHDVLSFLEKTFKNATFRHAGSVSIDLLFSNNSLKSCNLFLNFHAGSFELAAKENNKLVYYNVFSYETHEDALYYLLFMMEQYNLNPLTCKLVIAGQMEANAELLKTIKKYVKQVDFAVNDKSFSGSFDALKLPDHYFFSLTNQHLCVS